jgi:tetratricopeptide (TPR) repeat protein
VRPILACIILLTVGPAVAAPEKPVVPRPGTLDLKALADRIDPGPIDPWLSKLPDSVRVSRARARRKLGKNARLELERRACELPAEEDWYLRALLFSDILEEEVLWAPDEVGVESVFALALIYGSLGDLPTLIEPLLADLLSRYEHQGIDRKWMLSLLQQAPRLGDRGRRHLTALILRRGGPPEIVASILEMQARVEENCEVGLRLMEEALRRAPDHADAERWLDLAFHYYRTLEIPCGDAALAVGRRLAEEICSDVQGRIERLQDRRSAASRLLEIEGKTSFEDRLVRVDLLHRLGRRAEVERLYTALARERPRDARPRVGLARMALAGKRQDVRRARALIASARDLEHRDARYWETGAVVEVYGLMTDLAAAARPGADVLAMARGARDRLRPWIDGVRPTRPGLAGVVDLLLKSLPVVLAKSDSRIVAMRAQATRLLPKLVALTKSAPDERHPYCLLLTAASMGMDMDASFDALDMPVPRWAQGDAETELRRARTYLMLLVQWGRVDLLDACERLIDRAGQVGATHVDTLLLKESTRAIRARVASDGKGAAAVERWKGIEKGYRIACDIALGSEASMALSGIAVALAEQGRLASAHAVLEGAETVDPESTDVFRYNRTAIDILTGVRLADARECLEELSTSEFSTEIRAQALAWLGAIERGAGNPEKAMARFKEAIRVRDDGSLATGSGWNLTGVAIEGSNYVHLGVSPRAELVLDLELTSRFWPIIPAPVTAEEIAEARK